MRNAALESNDIDRIQAWAGQSAALAQDLDLAQHVKRVNLTGRHIVPTVPAQHQ